MAYPSQPVSDTTLGAIRGSDAQLFRLATGLLVFYLLFSSLGLLRLIGVSGIVPILLVGYRLVDMLLVFSFLVFWKGPIALKLGDFGLAFIVIFPALLGIHQFGSTYLNDIAIYGFFLIRLIIFRSLLATLLQRVTLDELLGGFLNYLVRFSFVTSAVLFILVQIALRLGLQQYYQVPFELTLAACFAIATGNLGYVSYFALFALVSGKRMIFVGMLAALTASIFWSRRIRHVLLRWLPLVVVLGAAAAFIGFLLTQNSGIAFVNKLTHTYQLAQRGISLSENWADFFILTMPDRYIEYVSLEPYLDSWALIFGNGYGFRYVLDYSYQVDFGLFVRNESITNAHFTPVAIVAKFGLFGLFGWAFVFLSAFRNSGYKRKHSSVSIAAQLALVSLLVQSLFAFGLFLNPFTAFILAVASVNPTPKHSRVEGE